MVNRLASWKSIFDAARDAMNVAKKLVGEGMAPPAPVNAETFTGQDIVEEIRTYVVQNEAIIRALATRLQENESENASLKKRLTKLESRVRWLSVLCLSLAIVVGGLAVPVVLHWISR